MTVNYRVNFYGGLRLLPLLRQSATVLIMEFYYYRQIHTLSLCSKLVIVSSLFSGLMRFCIYNLSILYDHINIEKGSTKIFLKVAIKNY